MQNDNFCFYNDEIDGISEWLWPKSDTQTFAIIKEEWPSLKEAIMKYVPERRVVIQAGGNCGMYPRLMANDFSIVYTYEPDPSNFFCLSYNCRQENIIKSQMALGQYSSSTSVHHLTNENCGMHRVSGEGAVPVMPIDYFSYPVVDLIQLDIEEYEIHALKGARSTILMHKPIVIIENATDEIRELMSSLKYSFAESLNRLDAVFVPEP